MSISETELKLIAKSVETIANTPDYRWLYVLVSVLVGFFLSEIKGWIQTWRKKRTVLFLLNDEIIKRWNGTEENERKEGIGQALKNDIELGENDQKKWLEKFATRKFCRQDLFIIDRISNSMQEFSFLEKNLLSNIVFAHVLANDLYDCQSFVRNLYEEAKSSQNFSSGLNQAMKDEIQKHFNYFSEIVRKLDDVLNKKIFPLVKPYGEGSACICRLRSYTQNLLG